MRQKIQELIDFHKSAKQEVFTILSELKDIGEQKLSRQDTIDLNVSISKYEEEYYWRSIFINQLEDIL